MISSLLTVCTGNICRSPMAAYLFADKAAKAGRRLDVASAGVGALIGYPPPEEVISIMDERGIDVRAHRARQITGEIARRFELIAVMERSQQQYIESNWPMLKGRVHLLCKHRNEEIVDPYMKELAVYKQSLEQIDAGVEAWNRMILS